MSLLFTLALTVSAAKAGESGTSPWQLALQFEYTAASDAFARLHRERPDDPRVLIGYASALLSRQPLTEGNIRKAHELLLHAEAVSPASSDEKPLAGYLLARVEQDHLNPARTESALDRYERLLADYPDALLADQASVQLALALLRQANPGDIRPALVRVESLLARVKSPDANRDIRYLLASHYWRDLRDGPNAIRHFRAMRALRSTVPARMAEIDLVIGGIALDIGDTPLALKHYRSFLEQLPRDIRAATVRTRVAGIEKLQPSVASSR